MTLPSAEAAEWRDLFNQCLKNGNVNCGRSTRPKAGKVELDTVIAERSGEKVVGAWVPAMVYVAAAELDPATRHTVTHNPAPSHAKLEAFADWLAEMVAIDVVQFKGWNRDSEAEAGIDAAREFIAEEVRRRLRA